MRLLAWPARPALYRPTIFAINSIALGPPIFSTQATQNAIANTLHQQNWRDGQSTHEVVAE